MDFKSKISKYLDYLRSLPEQNKRIILWAVVGILALIMLIFWIKSVQDGLSKLNF